MLLLLACAADAPADTAAAPVDPAAAGPYGAARHSQTLEDADRPLTVEVWYPTDAPAVAASPSALIADADDRAAYDALLAAAPADCPTRSLSAAVDASVAGGGPWPLVGMSHCYGCTRFSMASVAEHLATHGYVVVAPDHAGDTLFDHLDGAGLPLDTDTLALRTDDLTRTVDAALAGALGPTVDVDRVGLVGHSFGAVTAGAVLQGGATPARAALFVGAPPENPLLPGVTVAALTDPLFFLELMEDHSVGLAGNLLIEQNYADAAGPAWLGQLADAGHWSPSDLVGLTEDFQPGCGEDTRQDGGATFTYLDPAEGRAVTGAVARAFLGAALDEEADAAAWLTDVADPLTVTAR